MKNIPDSTPSSLVQAIENGITHALSEPVGNSPSIISEHVKDFLRQKFGIAFLRAGDDQDKLEMLHSLGAMIGINEVSKKKEISTSQEQRLKAIWDGINNFSKAGCE